jgi:hypothetical protein
VVVVVLGAGVVSANAPGTVPAAKAAVRMSAASVGRDREVDFFIRNCFLKDFSSSSRLFHRPDWAIGEIVAIFALLSEWRAIELCIPQAK